MPQLASHDPWKCIKEASDNKSEENRPPLKLNFNVGLFYSLLLPKASYRIVELFQVIHAWQWENPSWAYKMRRKREGNRPPLKFNFKRGLLSLLLLSDASFMHFGRLRLETWGTAQTQQLSPLHFESDPIFCNPEKKL